jgi:hypothetical protein
MWAGFTWLRSVAISWKQSNETADFAYEARNFFIAE